MVASNDERQKELRACKIASCTSAIRQGKELTSLKYNEWK
jgi:hypothetical protein